MSLELDQAKTTLVVIDMTKGVVSLASGPYPVSSDTSKYQQVGVTWWVEKILPERGGSWTDWPLEAMRARIRQGPPR